ncbi:putative F-box protein At4g22660 [Corylus avellana]|uniref:putative F-box protein At4g22660 n=1 Tax=Corylus avellana TaxID=13451 RepID=UPI001E1EEE94|nr:putative F-box protein At4g22660 [Corylus avellana]
MAPVTWSKLPEDLLESILRKPTNVVNLYKCSFVCHAWRSVVERVLASTPPHRLVYSKELRIVRSISFKNVFTGATEVCRLPEFNTGDGRPLFPRSVYSWHRWLVMDCSTFHACNHLNHRGDHHICLYDPFSNARIRFPAFTLDNFVSIDPTRRKFVVSIDPTRRKFVVSCDPKNPRSIGLAVRNGRYLEKLMFWKPGDGEWTTFVVQQWRIFDITSYEGGFCVLDGKLKRIEFDHELGTLKIKHVSSRYYHPTNYLVESLCGDLLLVQLDIEHKVEVFRMDWVRKAWDEIKSLGDEAIFLSCHESVSIQAKDYTIFKPNCIYFTDGAFSMPVEQMELGVYDIANQTVGSVPLSIPRDDKKQCYRWFTTQI